MRRWGFQNSYLTNQLTVMALQKSMIMQLALASKGMISIIKQERVNVSTNHKLLSSTVGSV